MFIHHDEADLFVVSFGGGSRTLVGLGGWTGSWEVWADVFGILSQSWRTVGIDHRGTGATVAPPESISHATMTADLFAVLDKLGIEKCVLAAESSGTAVALTAAQQQPERFEGLVLVGGLYYRPDSTEPDRFLMGLERVYETAVNQFIANCLPETNSPAVHQWANKILMRASQDAAIALYKANFGLDLRPALRHITPPTLIIHGDADRIVPVEAARWLATQLPNNQLTILPGAGHAPMMTMPNEVAAAIKGAFKTSEVC